VAANLGSLCAEIEANMPPKKIARRIQKARSKRLSRSVRHRIHSLEPLEDRALLANFSPVPNVADGAANSLRAAIIASNTNNQNDTITLKSGTYSLSIANTAGQENAAAQGDLDLTEAGRTITFRGAGAGKTIIEAKQIDRVFDVLGGVTVVFKDLTITGGVARDDGTTGADLIDTDALGGGILSRDGTVTLEKVVIANNKALGALGSSVIQDGKSGKGGGIFISGKSLKVQSSTFQNNEASGGLGHVAFTLVATHRVVASADWPTSP
jgi:hypothetical protein